MEPTNIPQARAFPTSESAWRVRPRIRLDDHGPVDVPYNAEAASRFESAGGIEVIEAVARRFPAKIAIDDGNVRLTYAQFIDHVYDLARQIAAATSTGSVVASLVHNSVVSPIIVMACAFSGRVLVPIDASHPPQRRGAIFNQSGADVVLLAVDDEVDDSFLPETVPRIVVDPLSTVHAVRPPYQYNPNAPLFVAFTSGSTGHPKGVVSGGRYGGEALRHFVDMFHLNSADVILGLASLSTGGSRDAFAALGTGARIRTFDVRSGGFGDALRIMAQEGVTILSFVPSALRMILAIEGAEQAFRQLRVLDLHGERVLASDIALFRAKLPQTCHISITMGSIESGAVFSWFVRDEEVTGPVAPVGYPLPGRSVMLLDEQGRPVPDGEVGELLVRGAMALGAWREGRIVQGPFLPDPDDGASRIYATGDRMRRRPDGLYEYVGRKDRRVKIRALWADLDELEAALRTVQGVAEAVVIAAGDQADAERLVAFIVMEPGRTLPALGIVRRAVAEATAEHVVPAEVTVLAAIPRLGNFKPDLVRLKAMAGKAGA